MAKSTDLKLTKKKVKEVHETEKYELEDGSTVTFFPIFPHTKVRILFKELEEMMKSKPEEVELTNELADDYLRFLMIKHFTHFKSQLKATTFVEQLNEIEALIDLEVDGKSVFYLITDEIFLPKEVKKVSDYAVKHIAQYAYFGKLEQQIQEEVGKLDLKNREILENVFKGRQSEVIQ